MNIAEAIKLLQLDRIEEEWTVKVWESEFMDIEGIPGDYEEVLYNADINDILTEIKFSIKNSLQKPTDTNTCSWPILVQEHGVQYKELLALLVYFMKTGQTNPANEQALQTCIKAACVYFYLLMVHGSSAYFIFQTTIYETALDTVMLGSLLSDNSGKKSKSARDAQNEEDEDIDPNRKLTERAKYILLQGLHELLQDLSFMASIYPLVEESLRKILFNLVALTRVDSNSSNINLRNLRKDCTMSSLTCNAYFILQQLCNPMHGEVEETVNMILMFLFPSVIMGGKHTKDMSFAALSKICNHALSFVVYLILTVKEDCYNPVYIFIQYLCTSVIDRAEYRQKTAESVVCIMRLLPATWFAKMIKWFLKFSLSKKSSHRLFAVEIMSKLLYEDERPALLEEEVARETVVPMTSEEEEAAEERMEVGEVDDETPVTQERVRISISHRYLLGVLFSRCHDSSSSVRTKALSNLAECMRSNNEVVRGLMHDIFVAPYVDNDNILNPDIVERGFMDSALFLKSLDNPRSQEMDPLPGGKAVVAELLLLAQDDKVFVRKAALQMIETIMKINKKWRTRELLEVLCDHCRDPSLLIQKQSMQALTDLLFLDPEDRLLPEMYIGSVLPQVSSAEMKVQEKMLEVMQKVIFQNLVPYDRTGTPLSKLPWRVVEAVIKGKKSTFFLKACFNWQRSGDIPKNVVRVLKTHIGTENNTQAWMLLACVAENQDIKDLEFALDYYRNHHVNPSEEVKYGVIQALMILGMSLQHLSDEDKEQLLAELLDALRCQRLDISLTGPAVNVATLITHSNHQNMQERQQAVAVWAEELLKLCEAYILQHSPSDRRVVTVNMERYTRVLVLLGDVVQLCPGHIKMNTVLTILNLFMPERQCHPQLWKVEGLAALAVITLGKICLQHEAQAKHIVAILGNLLTCAEGLAVKVNTMSVLSDMCMRYTAMVEPLVPKMCSCLTDPQPDVRYNSLLILIRLLQQDFLKLRGTLFFYLLNMLRDPARSVRELINYYLCECLVKSHPNVMFHNIVEALFYFNKYEGHEIYSHITENDNNQLFNLSGPAYTKERQRLYRFMCEHMDDVHRIKAIQKICVDIFGGVVANMITLNGKGESVVRDAFFVLSCEELQLSVCKKTTSTEDDAPSASDQVNAVVKKALFMEVLKKQLFDVCLPILLQLRVKLGTVESQLLPTLRVYMRDLMKEHKDELMDIFSDNKFFAEEILAEIQKEEEERHVEKRRSRAAGDVVDESTDQQDSESNVGVTLLVQLATDHLRNLDMGDIDAVGDVPIPGPSQGISQTPSINTSPSCGLSETQGVPQIPSSNLSPIPGPSETRRGTRTPLNSTSTSSSPSETRGVTRTPLNISPSSDASDPRGGPRTPSSNTSPSDQLQIAPSTSLSQSSGSSMAARVAHTPLSGSSPPSGPRPPHGISHTPSTSSSLPSDCQSRVKKETPETGSTARLPSSVSRERRSSRTPSIESTPISSTRRSTRIPPISEDKSRKRKSRSNNK